MKKLILSAFMLAAFAAVSSAQTTPPAKTQGKSKMQHGKMKSDTAQASGTQANKNWSDKKMMKNRTHRKGADSTGTNH